MALTLVNLTPKEIRYAIKKHTTPDELCRKYNCTEAELRRRISLLFRSERDCDEVTKQLCAARRHPKQAAKEKEEKKTKTPASDPKVVDATKTVDTAKVVNDAQVFDTAYVGESQPSDKLPELKATEQELSAIVMQLENNHVALANEHRGHIKDMRALENKLTELKAQLVSIGKEYEDIANKSNLVVSQMNVLSSKIYAKRAELDRVRARIMALEQVVIAVTADGVELFSGPADLAFDDSGHEELARELFDHSDLCADLKKRDIQLLARVIKIVEHINQPIEAIFDNPELEAVYELYLEPASTEAS